MKKAYRCKDCGHETVVDAKAPTPECCGEPMNEIPLESCREAGPEATRPGDDEEPCEDFTGKQV
ncbi:MAG: hypothetical protein SNJ56_05175 [Termitinemataceae bacterium]